MLGRAANHHRFWPGSSLPGQTPVRPIKESKMESQHLKMRVKRVKQRAHGNWDRILTQLLRDPKVINRKNQPCPKCQAGRDRFQYTDKFGEGDAHCRYCGHLGGFDLLQCVNGWSFVESLKAVETSIGATSNKVPTRAKAKDAYIMRALARQLWDEAQPITTGDEVDRYLRARGLGMDRYPESLRTHPALGYYVKEPGKKKARLVRTLPAMLARLQDEAANMVTLHRTYVEQATKARVPDPKKCLSSFEPGPAIRLFESTEELAIAEGIETALAIHRRWGKPVWATYSASNMEHVRIPAKVRRICIYADNDASFTGQAAAYALARRLKAEEKKTRRRDVQVFVPSRADTDWADVWVLHLQKLKQAA